ncbi:MAG TPA: CARDB domain-containing protein, partial [Anaerolineales bacterium]|nr:CARDB domain-containing protein [Anaerolineales bacterium]
TVKNNGLGSTITTQWSDAIYLSTNATFEWVEDDLLETVPHTGVLDPSSTYMVERSIQLPEAIYGDFYLLVMTDRWDAVYENVWEENNLKASAVIHITLTPPPDLVVSNVVVPAEGQAGEPMIVSWDVTNNGAGETFESNWLDRIYLSSQATFDAVTATVLGTVINPSILAPGASYSNELEFTLPDRISGTYYVHVRTDYANQVFEFDQDNNNVLTSAPLTVSHPVHADLSVSSVSYVTEAAAGAPMTVAWRVENHGESSTVDSWTDQVYLLPTNYWTPGGLLLGSFIHQNGLEADSAYQVSRTIVLPEGLEEGIYVIHVFTDANAQVFEHQDEDNNTALGDYIWVDIAEEYLPSDLIVSEFGTPSAVVSGETYELSWTVNNDGPAVTRATAWTDGIYLSTDSILNTESDLLLTTLVHLGSLAKDSSYTQTTQVVIPNGIDGQYILFLSTDIFSKVIDSDRTNNQMAKATAIDLADAVDLTPGITSLPDQGVSGQSVDIAWQVTNLGIGSANGSWHDAVYLSTDSNLDASDHQVVSKIAYGPLGSNVSYPRSATFSLPSTISGNYYILVETDSSDQVYEHGAETNNLVSQAITILTPPPSDLIVSAISLPATAVPGASVNINWTIQNQGENTASGRLCDSVFISADMQWNLSDPKVGTLCYQINLPIGGSTQNLALFDLPASDVLADLTAALAASISETMPGITPGTYYAIVRTDVYNQIKESNDANNTSASLDMVAVDVQALALGVPVADTYAQNQGRYYKIEVPAGETLRISLDSQSTSATNELYVRFGEIPSRLNFDFMYSAPMEPDQEILVPATQEGAYYIFTLGASPVDNTQQISITADLVTFSLKAVTPAEVGRKGLVTLSITGAKFHPEAQVWLDNGVASFGSVLTHWVDSTTMYATFNLSQAPISPYDLSMYSDGSIMTLSEAVNLIDGIPGEVQISYNAPSNLRPGQNGVLTINYFNPGNTDVWGVNARILSENAAMRFPEELEFTSTEVVIPMVSQSGPPIMLMPGESQQATLFFHPTTENGDVKFKVWLETTESSFQASLPDGSEFTVPTADNLSVQLNDHPENSGKVVQSDSPISLLSSINGLPKEYITNNTFADVGKIQDLLMARESPLADYRYSHLGNELTAADIVYMASITADWEINPEILLVYLQMYYNLLDPISLTSAEIDQLVTFSIDAGQSLLDQLTWLAGILWSSADVNSEGMVTFANPQEPGGLELAETQGDFKAKYEGVFERSGPIELMATPIDWKPAFLKPMGGTLQINSFFDHSSLSNDNNISRFDDNVLPAKYGQTYGWYDGHRANDLVVIGNSSADVLAVKDGTVVYASTSESCTMEIDGKLVTRYGTTVKITHANGLRTSYRHLNSIGTNPRTSKVWTDKDEIYAGEIVGVEGTTGCSTGYHLDFRVDGGTSFATSYDVFGWWGAGADHYNQPLFSSGLVIDEQSGQGFQNFYWDNQWKRENIGEGGKSLSVLSSTIQEDPKKWAIWWATIPKVGKYEVFAFIPTGAQAKAVQYRVLYQDGKFSNLTIDQSANQNKWVSLGQYDFTVGGPAAVKLTEYSNGENGKKVFFDSIKWVEVVPESQPIPPGDTFWQEILVRIVRSMDPNDILGPEGYGEARWVAHDQILGYTIRYENDESQATAPAQRVVIEQVLAEQLDLRSFRLGAFGFHGLIYEVPANRSYYQNRLGPVDINGESLFVDLYAGIDIVSGEAFWIFQAIDPVTGEPPEDPLIGFLPPDIIEGEGQGFVSYSVKPKTNAQTGDVVNAMASIVFDQNDPIDTPVIFNTIDAVPPTSIMGAISPTTIGDQVLLTWETSDDAGGSGVAGVDLYLSVDDQPFELEIAAITESAFVYSGEVGHKYAFFTRATDFAGNREMIKDAPEVTTFMYIPDQAGVIELVATPSVLIANGIDSTTVRIVVKDGSGKVLPDQMVALITTDGTLSTQTVITDINGTANVVLTAPTNAIDIVLTATAGQSSEQLEINVVDEPTVSLEATSDAPTMLGQPTNFTAEVTGGTNVLVYWEFGDGLSDTGTNVTHVYETAGPYTVKVWAINDANELFYEINIVIDSPIEEPDNFIYLPVVIKN